MKTIEQLAEWNRLSHSASEKDAEYILIHHRPIIWELLDGYAALEERLAEAEETLRRIEFMTSKGTSTIFPASTIEACRDKARKFFATFPKGEG